MKAQILSNLVTEIFPQIESGLIKPITYKVLPIAEAAHAILQRDENVGKIVLQVK